MKTIIDATGLRKYYWVYFAFKHKGTSELHSCACEMYKHKAYLIFKSWKNFSNYFVVPKCTTAAIQIAVSSPVPPILNNRLDTSASPCSDCTASLLIIHKTAFRSILNIKLINLQQQWTFKYFQAVLPVLQSSQLTATRKEIPPS